MKVDVMCLGDITLGIVELGRLGDTTALASAPVLTGPDAGDSGWQ